MSKSTRYVRRKLNVPLFIVLLLCAFLPGLIYGIYCAIPSKVPAEKPKSSGWILMLVCLAVHVILGIVYVAMESWIIPIVHLAFSAIIFLMGLINKDGKSAFLTIMCLWFQLVPIILEGMLFAYLGPVGIALGVVAFIGSFIANIKLTAWDNYRRYGNQEVSE